MLTAIGILIAVYVFVRGLEMTSAEASHTAARAGGVVLMLAGLVCGVVVWRAASEAERALAPFTAGAAPVETFEYGSTDTILQPVVPRVITVR